MAAKPPAAPAARPLESFAARPSESFHGKASPPDVPTSEERATPPGQPPAGPIRATGFRAAQPRTASLPLDGRPASPPSRKPAVLGQPAGRPEVSQTAGPAVPCGSSGPVGPGGPQGVVAGQGPAVAGSGRLRRKGVAVEQLVSRS